MVVGATTSGVFLVAYVLAMEMVGPKFRFGFHIYGLPGKAILFESTKKTALAPTCRVVAGTLCQYYYTAGYLLMALVSALTSGQSLRS